MRPLADIYSQLVDGVASFWTWTYTCLACWILGFAAGTISTGGLGFLVFVVPLSFLGILASPIFLAVGNLPVGLSGMAAAALWLAPPYMEWRSGRIPAALVLLAIGAYWGHALARFSAM